ncbi:MAG: hypothetical protein JWP97_2503 [Labilithrix sp.]|nr:hypothetical protein [Labilithrix sp.]
MSRGSLRGAIIASVLFASMTNGARPAHADVPPECRQAYVGGQEDRRAGLLQRARGELLACSKPSCPPAIVADCADWLRDVERAIPSFVVAVVGADGAERTDALVYLDGVLVAKTADGRAIPADPGTHEVRVSVASEGELTSRVVLREGERNRAVNVHFAPHRERPAPVTGPPRADAPDRTRMTTASWILGGVGAAGLLTGGVLAASAFFGSPSLRTLDRCRPSCPEDEASKVHTMFVVSDVAAGVGLVAIGAAIILVLTHRTADGKP